MRYYEDLYNQIKKVEIDNIINWNLNEYPKVEIIDKQKVYIWIRLYLKDECEDLKIGDIIDIYHTVTGESLETQFIYYGRSDLSKNYEDQIVSFSGEENKKILCLMIDVDLINKNDNIPFLRTMFKVSPYYEYQIVRRSEMIFTNRRTLNNIEYYDVDW